MRLALKFFHEGEFSRIRTLRMYGRSVPKASQVMYQSLMGGWVYCELLLAQFFMI
jgi:hypothetical protein